MKSCLLTLFLTSVTICFSQENKLDSIRWIRIPDNSINKSFFQDNYSNRNFSTLIGCFWENTRNTSSIFFIEYSDIAEKQKLYFEFEKHLSDEGILIEPENRAPYYTKEIDSLFKENILFNFKKNSPYVDEYGDPWEIDCYSYFQFIFGLICYSYPPELPIIINLGYVQEIRIREELQRVPGTKEYKYIPTAIQLYTYHTKNLNNNIWLDLNRLKQSNPEIVNTEWFYDLINRYYTGEQYMQLKVR